MGRTATGSLETRRTNSGITYYARFTAFDKRWRIKLGDTAHGMTARRADEELQAIVSDVRRGRWLPERGDEQRRPLQATQTFHELASRWLEDREHDLSPSGHADYSWQLQNHLLPFFHEHYPLEITASEVDRLRTHLLGKRLSATSVNKCIRLLAQVLDTAMDYGLIEANPARNRRRYARRPPKRPVWLDRPEQIAAMLDAAKELDASPGARTSGREAFVAVLVIGGLRISEACQLRWRSIDFHNDLVRVEKVGKTSASFREVDMFPALRRRLEVERLRRPGNSPNDRVFTTATGNPRTKDNARQRIILPVVHRADERLVAAGLTPLPEGVSAHKLRHTYASLLVAMGYDPATVQEQLGHSDARFTLNAYTHQMRRGSDERQALSELLT